MSRDGGVILNRKIRPSDFLQLVIVIIIINICVARLPVYVEVRVSARVIFVCACPVDGLPPWLVPEGCQLRRIGD